MYSFRIFCLLLFTSQGCWSSYSSLARFFGSFYKLSHGHGLPSAEEMAELG